MSIKPRLSYFALRRLNEAPKPIAVLASKNVNGSGTGDRHIGQRASVVSGGDLINLMLGW